VVVEIEHFSPFPNCGSCVPDLPGKVSLDGRVQSFDGPGWLVWADVADGVHTLKILAGNYGGSADCGFWFQQLRRRLAADNGHHGDERAEHTGRDSIRLRLTPGPGASQLTGHDGLVGFSGRLSSPLIISRESCELQEAHVRRW